MTDPGSQAFERLARAFLAQHSALNHEWRPVRSLWSGDRLDLVVTPPSPDAPEVWVSLTDGQITVSGPDGHRDFENFGRPLTEEQVAGR